MLMRIMVTGGAGYLGSVLCGKLLDQGHDVLCYDTFLYGLDSTLDFVSNKNFTLIEGDIRNLLALAHALKDVDVVIHLASIVGQPATDLDPTTAFEINHLATISLAKLAKNRGVKHLIFASSCSVYGFQPGKMITEKSKIEPLDHYADHKLQSEVNLRSDFPFCTILRFGTLFGYSPRMRFDLVVNKFIAEAITGNTIEVYGGQQIRPFLHVSDAADSIIFALDKELEGTFNVISENMKLIHLAQEICDKLDVEFYINKDQTDHRSYNVSMAKINGFGFMPQKNLEFAINEIQKFFDENKIDYKDPIYSNYDYILIDKMKAFS